MSVGDALGAGVSVGVDVGEGVSVTVGSSVGVGVAVAVGANVGDSVGVAVGEGIVVAVGEGEFVGDGVAVEVGVGVGVEKLRAKSEEAAVAEEAPCSTVARMRVAVTPEPSVSLASFHTSDCPEPDVIRPVR